MRAAGHVVEPVAPIASSPARPPAAARTRPAASRDPCASSNAKKRIASRSARRSANSRTCTGVPAGGVAPRGPMTAPPRYVERRRSKSIGAVVRRRDGDLAGHAPAAASTVAPRTEATFHSPAGPSTRSFSGVASDRPSGHSFGDFQSYGPHSSTMMASRPRRSASGIFASMPPGSGFGSVTSSVDRGRIGRALRRRRRSCACRRSAPRPCRPRRTRCVSTRTFCVVGELQRRRVARETCCPRCT